MFEYFARNHSFTNLILFSFNLIILFVLYVDHESPPTTWFTGKLLSIRSIDHVNLLATSVPII